MNENNFSEKDLPQENNLNSLSLQEIISVGYIILIIVGMYLEYLEYIPFGINIIEHSDFADFLITPFKNPVMIIAPIIFSFLAAYIHNFKEKRKIHNKKILDEENKTTDNTTSSKPQIALDSKAIIVLAIFMFVLMNLGFGIGAYHARYGKIKERLDANITNAKIEFIGGESKEVYLLGKNTSNLFYFENSNIEIVVSPIQGNIKTIEYIPKDQQKQLEEN